MSVKSPTNNDSDASSEEAAAASEVLDSKMEAKGEAVDSEDRTSATVLLVDDDDTVRRFIATALTRLGYQVYEASDGRHGVEKYCELRDQIDVIISDVLMPELTGPEMIRELREVGWSPRRVLFVTGFPDNCLSSEFTRDFPDARRLDKPFTVDDLSRKVADLLN